MKTRVVEELTAANRAVNPGRARVVARKIATAPIRFYQVAISPYRNRTCRYYPTCSQYALTALKRYGVFKGSYLAIRRLLRCHPWTPGGVDHVPNSVSGQSEDF